MNKKFILILIIIFTIAISTASTSPTRAAYEDEENWSNTIISGNRVQLVEGRNASLQLGIKSSKYTGNFSLSNSNYSDLGASNIKVEAVFKDLDGNQIDLNNDGTKKTYSFTEISNGTWELTNIQANNIGPKYIQMDITGTVENSTSTIENYTLNKKLFIVPGTKIESKVISEDSELSIENSKIEVNSLTGEGALLDFFSSEEDQDPTATWSLTDENNDGLYTTQKDVIEEIPGEEYLASLRTGEDTQVLNVYSSSEAGSYLDNFEGSKKVVEQTEDYKTVKLKIKDGSKYNAFALKQTGSLKTPILNLDLLMPSKLVRTTDAYIIPRPGYEYHMTDGAGYVEMGAGVIKRNTYANGLTGNEKVIFQGNLYQRTVETGNLANNLKIKGQSAKIGAVADISPPEPEPPEPPEPPEDTNTTEDSDSTDDSTEETYEGTPSNDEDGDGIDDTYEDFYGFDDPDGDLDGDGYTNEEEINEGTLPDDPNSYPGSDSEESIDDGDADGDAGVDDGDSTDDSTDSSDSTDDSSSMAGDNDGDGIDDSVEAWYGFDDPNGDLDNDGLTNYEEVEQDPFSYPDQADSDGDGVLDPNDPAPLDPNIPGDSSSDDSTDDSTDDADSDTPDEEGSDVYVGPTSYNSPHFSNWDLTGSDLSYLTKSIGPMNVPEDIESYSSTMENSESWEIQEAIVKIKVPADYEVVEYEPSELISESEAYSGPAPADAGLDLDSKLLWSSSVRWNNINSYYD